MTKGIYTYGNFVGSDNLNFLQSISIHLPPCLAVAFLTVRILDVNLDATVTPSS